MSAPTLIYRLGIGIERKNGKCQLAIAMADFYKQTSNTNTRILLRK
jgi:hypothetical protein